MSSFIDPRTPILLWGPTNHLTSSMINTQFLRGIRIEDLKAMTHEDWDSLAVLMGKDDVYRMKIMGWIFQKNGVFQKTSWNPLGTPENNEKEILYD